MATFYSFFLFKASGNNLPPSASCYARKVRKFGEEKNLGGIRPIASFFPPFTSSAAGRERRSTESSQWAE